jgi:hypothetical protein
MSEKPKRKKQTPRVKEKMPSYGRQKKTKTIKSMSLDEDIAQWAEDQARREGISFSEFMSNALKRLMIFFFLSHLVYHWLSGSPDWLGAGFQSALDNGGKLLKFAGEIIADMIGFL